MTALAYAIPVLGIAACLLIGHHLGRRGHDGARPLSRRERAQWEHITRGYAAAQLEQDGSEDAR